jgi:glycosyltransferase involved in cell wall biosynthesis
MATAVLNIDVRKVPPFVSGLAAYDRALVLFRFGSAPISRVEFGLSGEVLSRDQLLEALGEHGRYAALEQRVQDILAWSDKQLPPMLPSATVAICTRDRPDDLLRCLSGVSALIDDGQEVLVVDNAPATDASRDVVASFPGVRYVREPRPGLNHARNCALQNATGDIVAFIDDDATPHPYWLRAILLNFDSPNTLCVTGLTMPLKLETPAQEQFEHYSTFARGFRRIVYSGDRCDPLAVGDIGSGTNMAVRRTLSEYVGGFDNVLDAGTPTQSGGDHEMLSRILRGGYRIIYEPAALNWHRHRRTYAELEKTIYGYGVGVYSAFVRALIRDREIGTLKVAYAWFRHSQLRHLWRAFRKRPGAAAFGLIKAELRGCLYAPLAYRKSVKRLASQGTPRDA